MSSARHRLFVAILPTGPVRAALAELADDLARARWTPPDQFHLSLRFIGDVTDEQLPAVADALAGVRVAPFPLGIEGVGRFPPRGQPGVVWVGMGRGHPLLHQLRQQVDDRLLGTGIPFELRPFVPHITVGRTRDASPATVAQWLKRHRDFVGPTWRVESFHLMASLLTPAGALHQILRTLPLHTATTAPRCQET